MIVSATTGTEDQAMIRNLFKYPVKGMSAQALDKATLTTEHGLAGDRSIAISRKPGTFDPAAPKALAKSFFLMLMRDEALALLDTHYDENSNRWMVKKDGAVVLDVDLTSPGDVETVQSFFADYLSDTRVVPELIRTSSHKFTDISVVSEEKARAVSLINLNSVAALSQAIGKPVDPMRFRANIYFDGVEAWSEFDWLDRTIEIGDCTVKGVMRTRRCAATQVNPETGIRDIDVPAELKAHFGHMDLGIYAEVSTSGDVRIGDRIRLD